MSQWTYLKWILTIERPHIMRHAYKFQKYEEKIPTDQTAIGLVIKSINVLNA